MSDSTAMKGATKMQIGTILKPDGTTQEIKPKTNGAFALTELQDAVGGFIEIVRLKPGTPWSMLIVNEEGKLRNLPFNSKATEFAAIALDDCIVGDALLISTDNAMARQSCNEPASKIETLKMCVLMFCNLVDDYIDGGFTEQMLIAKMYRARNEVLAALPELNALIRRPRQRRSSL
jgi:hypothetical protein